MEQTRNNRQDPQASPAAQPCVGRRACISDESLNSYGSRVLTAGIDLAQYERNPVLLYMHERGAVIGTMQDLRREDGGRLTGTPVFDCASELSRRCAAQWAAGSLRMLSMGIDIRATSRRPEDLLPGQTAETVAESRLLEVSVVDIGANDNALVMHRDGVRLKLGRGADGETLPLLFTHKPQETMNEQLIQVATLLGLAPETGVDGIIKAIGTLKEQAAQAQTLTAELTTTKQELLTLRQEGVQACVDAAVAEGRILQSSRDHFIALGTEMGMEKLKKTLACLVPERHDITLQLTRSETAPGSSYQKLSDVPSDKLLQLRREDPKEYRRLFRQEYGFDCEIED